MTIESWNLSLQLVEQMVTAQEERVLHTANRLNPRLTGEDILQPHNHPELETDPVFQFEDGILTGLRSALHALRAERNRAKPGTEG